MRWLAVEIIAFLLAVPSTATTRLMKLSEDHYLITVQKATTMSGHGLSKGLSLLSAKAASLCVVLDYSWLEVLALSSHGRTLRRGAASTLEVKFYREKDEEREDLLNCEGLATEEQKQEMRNALLTVRQ